MFLFIVTFLFSLPIGLYATSLEKICIIEDSAFLDTIGYNNCNMVTNGELQIIQSLVPGKGIVFDVGANVGEWSSTVLKYSPEAKLLVFEPIPHLFKNLCAVFKKRAHVYKYAISHEEGERLFEYYPECSAVSGLYHRPALSHMKEQKIVVDTTTLDLFCEKHNVGKINFLKIDTEGNEWNVLRGASQLLQDKAIDMIQFEYGGTYPDAGITLAQVYEFLKFNGYEVYRIASNYLIHIPQWRDALENYQYSNYLAVCE